MTRYAIRRKTDNLYWSYAHTWGPLAYSFWYDSMTEAVLCAEENGLIDYEIVPVKT